MFLALICLACIVVDAKRMEKGFVSQSAGAIPATHFARAFARHATREISWQPARAPVMQQLGHSSSTSHAAVQQNLLFQRSFKFVQAGSTELSQAVKATALAAEQGKLYNRLNANKSAWMSSVVQSPTPRQLLAQHFDKFATDMRLPISALVGAVPTQSAQWLKLRRNLARSTLDTFFASLLAKDVDQALPRAFVSHLGMVSLSAGDVAMKRQVFAIVKFANGKYRLLQGYGTSEPGTDLNTMLHSSIPFDKTFGDEELHRLEYSLRSLVEFGAQADSAHEVAVQTSLYAPEKLDKQFGVSLTCVELNANSLPDGPNLPSEEVEAETLVAKMWKQSNMVVVNEEA